MPRDNITRRRALRASAAGLMLAAAGCSSDGGSQDGDGGTDGGGDGGGGEQTTAQSGSDGGDGGDSEVHLLMDYTSEAWQKRWEETLVPGFKEEHPDTSVNVEYVGFQGNSEQRLTTLIQSGNPPNAYQGSPNETSDLLLEDQGTPTNEVVDFLQETNGEIWYDEIIQFGPDNDYYYVPHGIYTVGTVSYRSDIYDQLGLEVPGTWDELLTNVEEIDTDSDIDARGYSVGAGKAGKADSEFDTYLSCADAEIFRWKSDAQEEVELWFPEDKVVETLSFMEQLAEYSTDPSSNSWAGTLKYWAGGRIAHLWHLNAWSAGIADAAGVSSIARNTDIFQTPIKDGEDPPHRGDTTLDSAFLLDAGGKEQTKEFFKYIYNSPQRTAENLLLEPMRFLPPYKGFMENETYKNAEVFQKYDGHLYDLNKKCFDEVMPNLSSPDVPTTAITWYVQRFPITSEMVNQVIVQGRNKTDAYRDARAKLEERTSEAREKREAVFG